MRIHRGVAGAFLVCCLAGAPAAAQTPLETHSLRWDPALDLTVTVGGAATWIVSGVYKRDLAPRHWRWCDVDSVGGRVAPGRCRPEAPTDPDVQISRIRL